VGAKSVVIIGAGIGGLAAGCAARQQGFEVQILEMHGLPGGLCTSWTRSGYTFDGSIHHLAGCRPGTPLYRMWEELGAMPTEVLLPEDLTQVETPDGRRFTVYTDLDRLEEHMLDLFPEDRQRIRSYVSAARKLARYDLLETVVRPPIGLLRYLPAAPQMIRWGRFTMAQAAERFRNPFLRRAFATIQYDWPDIPVAIHLNMLAQCAQRNYGFPVGGSLPFARSIEQRFRELGGTIEYGQRVERILVEGDRAVGVRLADSTTVEADAVISNAFAPTTLFRMLEDVEIPKAVLARFAKPSPETVMGIHVSLGVARNLSDEPHALVLLLDDPTVLADRTLDRIAVELYGLDETLAPPGKGVIKVLLNTDYTYWEQLAESPTRYAEAKERLGRDVVEALGARFPGLGAQVEVLDVATPLTTERYTGVGLSYTSESGDPSLACMLLGRPLTLSTVRNLWLVGQSAGGAGIPGCAAQGRHAVRALRRAHRHRFRSNTT